MSGVVINRFFCMDCANRKVKECETGYALTRSEGSEQTVLIHYDSKPSHSHTHIVFPCSQYSRPAPFQL